MNTEIDIVQHIKNIVQKSRTAQVSYEKYNQKQVDEVVTAIAWAICNPTNNRKIAELSVETTKLGNVEDKIIKNKRKTLGLLRDLKNKKTVGIIDEDTSKGIIEIAKPVGVVAAVTPATNPAATPVNNIINAVKGRNAIIVSPSPSGSKVFEALLKCINTELDKINAPKDLIQSLPSPISKDLTKELMKQVDLVIVTGSQNNVRQAYSSGTPSIGVGQGNVTVIVDETSNIKIAAQRIKQSKIFDNATSCSSENNLIILEEIYDDMLLALKSEGGLLFNDEQKNILEKSLWQNGQLNRNLLAKSVAFILNQISIDGLDSENSKFIMIEEKGIGKNSPFSGEKLSPILTIYKAKNFVEAKNIANEILNYQGKGHSIGIHSEDEKRILDLGLELPVCRVIVNQSHTFATGGSFTNGLPFSLSMGCGTWGGNSIDNNLNYKHFLNITKISKTIQGEEPSLRDYFDEYCETYSPDDSKLLQ